jgi:hypothetical protein
MNFCSVGDTVINLDQVQYIAIEERDEDGQPILAMIHFASPGADSTSSKVVIAETLIEKLFKAIHLEDKLLPG